SGRTDNEERHRHRYEFHNVYKEELGEAGLLATGHNPETGLVEGVEIPDHPWFVGVQYHPEYKSTVANPHPLFVGFVKAVHEHKQKQKNANLSYTGHLGIYLPPGKPNSTKYFSWKIKSWTSTPLLALY